MKPSAFLSLCLYGLSMILIVKSDLPSLESYGSYYIASLNMEVLDVTYGQMVNNATVISYPPKQFDASNQIWQLQQSSTGGYRIVSTKDFSFFLTAIINDNPESMGVILHKFDSAYNQVWNIKQFGNNSKTFTITTMDDKYSLQYVGHSRQVILVLNNSSNPNLWIFSKTVPVETSNPLNTCACYPGSSSTAIGTKAGPVTPGLAYFIKSTSNDKVLDVVGEIARNNNPVTTWRKKGTAQAKNQIWVVSLQSAATNTYKFTSILPGGLLLTNTPESVVIYQDVQDNDPNQGWTLETADLVNYHIKTSNGTKFLGISDKRLVVNDDDTQYWTFSEIYITDPSNCECPTEIPAELPGSAHLYPGICDIQSGSAYAIVGSNYFAITAPSSEIDGVAIDMMPFDPSTMSDDQLWNATIGTNGRFVFTSVKYSNFVLYYSGNYLTMGQSNSSLDQSWLVDSTGLACNLKTSLAGVTKFAGILDDNAGVVLGDADAYNPNQQYWGFLPFAKQ